MSLSLCRRTFKLKGYKNVGTWIEMSLRVFFGFRDSYVLCIYVMNVPYTFRIFMYMALVQIKICDQGRLWGIEVINKDRCINHHHHHVPPARISLTLSRHFSLSFIASGRSFGQHPVSSHSCWMYVRAGRPAFARLCVGVHKSIQHDWLLFNSSSFKDQQRETLSREILFCLNTLIPFYSRKL